MRGLILVGAALAPTTVALLGGYAVNILGRD
jgi:hypothetical protein